MTNVPLSKIRFDFVGFSVPSVIIFIVFSDLLLYSFINHQTLQIFNKPLPDKYSIFIYQRIFLYVCARALCVRGAPFVRVLSVCVCPRVCARARACVWMVQTRELFILSHCLFQKRKQGRKKEETIRSPLEYIREAERLYTL